MTDPDLLVASIEETLPQLRRFARALSGSQRIGDNFAAELLEKILGGEAKIAPETDAKVQLFRELLVVIRGAGLGEIPTDLSSFEKTARSHLAVLEQDAQEALLLSSLEGFSPAEIGIIRNSSARSAERDIARAQIAIASMIAGRVLIIEDESIIGLELAALVNDLGHDVTGVAPSYSTAVELGISQKPDLILADIKLADEKTGIEAVQSLIEKLGQIPTIFITAYPELFLTGERPEPAFLIAKPFTETQIRTAVGQAMFFSTTDALVEVS